MIDLSKLKYRLVAITSDGAQLDLTEITSALGWAEESRQLAAKITCKLACVPFNGKSVMELVHPFTPLFVYADMGSGFEEVIRGTVQKYELVESNGEFTLNIEAADECQALRQSQDDFYFSDSHSSTAILEKILSDWGVPHEIQVTDAKHAKKVYRGQYLSDMIEDVLKDLKEKGGGVYFMRAKGGVIQIIPRGSNETIYHFDIDDNVVRVRESFDASEMVTRVKVVGKSKDEGHQAIEATVDGKTEYGTRQVIYQRGDKESLEEAQTAAKKILDEQGDIRRKTNLESPDLPTLRKGDRIRIRSSTGQAYFLIKSIRHDAAQMKMSAELDYDKGYSETQGTPAYDLAKTDESNSSSPP